jgi:hypothetical protein
MKFTNTLKTSFAAVAVGLVLTLPATANNFSVSGAGGAIADGVGTWNVSLPGAGTASTVNVPRTVTSITSVTITGLTHTWVGDVNFVLKNPAGQRVNVFSRPGLTSATSFGNSGDFLGGTYTFFAGPGSALPAAGNPAAGSYIQNFGGTGLGAWTNVGLIANTNLAAVTGASGTWTLEAFDWGAGDTGSFSGWTLNGEDSSSAISAFCLGDGSGTQCPCTNGDPGRGCKNSKPGAPFGALLTAVNAIGGPNPSVSVTANDLGLKAENMMAGSYTIFFQGTSSLGAGNLSPFYDGLECVGGTIVRLGRITTMGGTNTLAGAAGVAGLAASAQTLHYQAAYRNSVAFCTPATLNTSNALTVNWTP